jgi:hypothetical protein
MLVFREAPEASWYSNSQATTPPSKMLVLPLETVPDLRMT